MKHYCLYNNKKQEKLLAMASSEEKMKEITEYYTSGTWFSYDAVEGSSLITNEKELKGIKFPEIAKSQEQQVSTQKESFKWVA